MTNPSRRWAPFVLLLLVLTPVLTVGGTSPVAADEISDKRAEAQRLASKLEQQAAEASRLAEAYNQARLKAAEAEETVARAQADADRADAELAERRGQVREQAVVAYMRGGSTRSIEALSRASGESVALQQAYLRTITSRVQEAIDALRVVRTDAGLAKERAARAAQSARRQAEAVEASKAAAEAVAAEQRATLAQVRGELNALVAAEQRRRAEEEARRARAEHEAREAARRATTTTTTTPRTAPSGPVPGGGTPAPNPGAAAAVEEARKQIGKPYQWGGEGPDSFDCSGLVLWSWKAGGRRLPHSAQAQYNVTTHISVSEIAPGDIVFFGSSTSNIHHNGLYVGDGQMIEASQSGTPVRYRSIFRRDLVAVGRVN